MNEFFQCAVCFENFDTKIRIPRLLPCQHSFCSTCLPRLMTSYSSRYYDLYTFRKDYSSSCIECPVCRARHYSKIDDIPKSRLILNLLEFTNGNQNNINKLIAAVSSSNLADSDDEKLAKRTCVKPVKTTIDVKNVVEVSTIQTSSSSSSSSSTSSISSPPPSPVPSSSSSSSSSANSSPSSSNDSINMTGRSITNQRTQPVMMRTQSVSTQHLTSSSSAGFSSSSSVSSSQIPISTFTSTSVFGFSAGQRYALNNTTNNNVVLTSSSSSLSNRDNSRNQFIISLNNTSNSIRNNRSQSVNTRDSNNITNNTPGNNNNVKRTNNINNNNNSINNYRQTTHDWNLRNYLRSLFKEMDMNKDGYLCFDELQEALRRGQLNSEFNVKTVQLLFERFDTNKDGEIDFDGFYDMYMYLNNEYCVFLSMDKDGNGTIDAEELYDAFTKRGYKFRRDFFNYIESTMRETNKNGITFDNYCRLSARFDHLCNIYKNTPRYQANTTLENYLKKTFFFNFW